MRVTLSSDKCEVALLSAGLGHAVEQFRVVVVAEAKAVDNTGLVVVKLSFFQERL